MSRDRDPSGRSPGQFRGDFRESRWIGVRVRTSGFEVDGAIHESLRGRVVSTVRVRKLFEQGVLTCRSPDGERSDQGVSCEACANPACRPLLRIQVEDGDQIYVLDLPHSSARNLIRVADDLAVEHVALAAVELRMEIVDQGHWGEVHFHRA